MPACFTKLALRSSWKILPVAMEKVMMGKQPLRLICDVQVLCGVRHYKCVTGWGFESSGILEE